MTILNNLTSATVTNAHGEMNFVRVDGFTPSEFAPFTDKTASGGFIIGHSETGHHHVLSGDVDVMERVSDGMRILYAIVKSPAKLHQDAANPHEAQTVEPGEYLITTAREYDPFLQQARRVAD